jgi:hypothetical protein
MKWQLAKKLTNSQTTAPSSCLFSKTGINYCFTHHTNLALCERKVADIKIDSNDETDNEEEIIKLALLGRKAGAIKIDSNDKTDEEEEIIKVNSDDIIEDKEETQTGNCLACPFAAHQENIERYPRPCLGQHKTLLLPSAI